jgi:4-alpha-glucanotransferase
LPNDQGIGVLDASVHSLLGFMHDAGIRQWQICPLGPTGYGDSPYQCFSAFAGNPYLVDLYPLVQCGLLTNSDLDDVRQLPRDHVDYGWLYVTKFPLLFKAFSAFADQGRKAALPYGDFEAFKHTHRSWLEPYALFLGLKDHFKGAAWWEWPADVRFFAKAKKSTLAKTVAARAEAHAFFQYLFFGQWARVRAHAKSLGIEIIGDAPIFVARDSADVWAAPQLFHVDHKTGVPLAVAGVPPDYFSTTGQLWGTPVYRWWVHRLTGFRWWLQRLQRQLELMDLLRLDHFRALEAYWSVPGADDTEPGEGHGDSRAEGIGHGSGSHT